MTVFSKDFFLFNTYLKPCSVQGRPSLCPRPRKSYRLVPKWIVSLNLHDHVVFVFWLRLLLTTEHTFIFKKWIYFYILWDYNALEENMFFFQAMGIRAAGAFSTCVWTSVCGEKALRSGCIHPSATSTKTTTTSIKK